MTCKSDNTYNLFGPASNSKSKFHLLKCYSSVRIVPLIIDIGLRVSDTQHIQQCIWCERVNLWCCINLVSTNRHSQWTDALPPSDQWWKLCLSKQPALALSSIHTGCSASSCTATRCELKKVRHQYALFLSLTTTHHRSPVIKFETSGRVFIDH